jgi:hypothetical protein
MGLASLLALALPASAQLVTTMNQKGRTTAPQSGASSFFTSPLQKLNFTGMSFRRPMPAFPNLQNSILLRNVMSPTTTVILPKTPQPPPQKK